MKAITQFILFLSFALSSTCVFANPSLTQWLPYAFEEDIDFIENTPFDLLNTTNAYRVFGAEYQIEGEIFVEIFAAWTKQTMYDNGVNVIYRAEGNVLEELEIITVGDFDFILSTYTNTNLEKEYIVSLDLEHTFYDKLSLLGSWAYKDFESPHSVYHYELKFNHKPNVSYFLEAMIKRIEDFADLNQNKEDLICPKTYVKSFQCFYSYMNFSIFNEQDAFQAQMTTSSTSFDLMLNEKNVDDYQVPISIDQNEIFTLNGSENDFDIFLIKAVELSSTDEEIYNLEINIFPNPTSDFINIKINHDTIYRLTDSNGKELEYGQLSKGIKDINISNLNSGNYYLSIISDGEWFTKKVIVI